MKRTVEGETIADIMTGKPIPLVVYSDDHAEAWHTHDVEGDGELLFRYPPIHDVPVSRSVHRPSPNGWPQHYALAPVEKVEVWFGSFHPFEPTIEGDLGSPCKTCKPWGIGAHIHYPAYEYVAPEHIYEVSYDDIEDHREDSVFYSKAKATARAEVLNREIHADYVKGFEQARERWALEMATRPLTDEDIGFLDARLIAEAATDKGIRKAARAVAEAFNRPAQGDPREALAFCEAEASKTFEEWLADNHAAWRVGEVRLDDARGVSDDPTEG